MLKLHDMKCKTLIGAMFLIIMGMSSCSSDNLLNDELSTVKEGESSYAAFSIKIGMPGITRSEEDSNADTGELSINTVKMYIFSQGILEVTATPEINSDVTVPVAVSTGEKVIYTLTNDKINVDAIVGQTLLTDFKKELFNSLPETIADSGHFVMIGETKTVITKCTESEALANPIQIAVDRATAKLQVKYNQENVEIYPTINSEFSECSFAPAQCARQMYICRSENLFTPIGVRPEDSGTYTGLTPVPENYAEDFFSSAVESYSPTYSKNRYMGENIAEDPTTGKITFTLIRIKVTPKEIISEKNEVPTDGTFYVAARNVPETATWIFASDEEYKIVYFASEEDAAAYIEEKGLGSDYKPYKYDKGYCYYRLNIANTGDPSSTLSERYRVVRNNYYRLSINYIKNLGAPTAPGVVPSDPDTPIEQDSYISCEMEIVPWTMHEQNGTLQ